MGLMRMDLLYKKRRSEDLLVDSLETGHLSLVLYLLPRQVNSAFPAFLAAAKLASKSFAAALSFVAGAGFTGAGFLPKLGLFTGPSAGGILDIRLGSLDFTP
jgi:hypothetical protein